MKFKKGVTLLLILLSSTLLSQVSFVAKVSKRKLGMNERLRVDFIVNQDGDNFEPPNFNGFRVSAGPNQSVSRSWVNGKSSYNKTFSYFLTPQKIGLHKIGQATIIFKGQRYKSNTVQIQITPAVDRPTDGENPDYIADRSLHLVARISNTNPYLNEAVTLEYILYWDEGVSISTPQELESPKFSDFWNQNIQIKQLQAKTGTYKGKPSAFVVLKKYVLYPQKTGKLKLTPLTLNVPIQIPTNKRDFFGRILTTAVNKSVSAGNTIINVKPLPPNAPPGFTGAVGQFNFNVTQSKNKLNATESLQVKIQISGKGNLKLFKLPVLKVPKAIEIYDPEYKERVRTNLSGMQGSISDTYTLVPQYKGTFPIPVYQFSYFDPKAKKYKRLASQNLKIEVLQGPTQQNNTNSNTSTNTVTETNQQKVVQEKTQFKFIKSEPNLKLAKTTSFFKSTLYWGLLLLPLILIIIVIVITKKTDSYANDVKGSKIREASKLSKKYLSSAKKNFGDPIQFYVSLEKALHNYLKAKLHIETSEMNKERIKELLESKSVNNETILGYVSLLESCEMARYTPSTEQTMEQDFNKASQVISQIDKQL